MDVMDELKYFAGELLGLNSDPAERARVLRYAHDRLTQMAEDVALALGELESQEAKDDQNETD